MAVGKRKRHVQQPLFRRGGKRRGAGRKPTGRRAGDSHRKRPLLDGSQALHVVLRARSEIGNMRQPRIYKAIRDAMQFARQRGRIRIVHLSIQRDHLHLLVEADSKDLLAKGIAGFKVAVARNVNLALASDGVRRRGSVFAHRYHLTVITTPTQARRVLAYVINNWRKHREDVGGMRAWLTDPYSSGRSFADWLELADGRALTPAEPTYGALAVSAPESWLLRAGWKRAGPISAFEVPSRRAQ